MSKRHIMVGEVTITGNVLCPLCGTTKIECCCDEWGGEAPPSQDPTEDCTIEGR